jgi:uncharacterized metal-binding protein YceD (DUF177 family)
MTDLSLKIRYEDLKNHPRDFIGFLDEEVVKEAVDHLAGQCGYFPQGQTKVTGSVYSTVSGEVIVNGRIEASLKFMCVGCAKEHILSFDFHDDFVVLPKNHDSAANLEDADIIGEGMWEDEPDVYTFSGHEIDLSNPFRETLIVNLNPYPRCEDVNQECGKIFRSLDEEQFAEEDRVDPRWAPLLALKKQLAEDEKSQKNQKDSSFSQETKEKDAKKS